MNTLLEAIERMVHRLVVALDNLSGKMDRLLRVFEDSVEKCAGLVVSFVSAFVSAFVSGRPLGFSSFLERFSKERAMLAGMLGLRFRILIDLLRGRLRSKQQVGGDAREARSGPPKFGEYLIFMFLSKQDRINLIGDLEEEYRESQERFGRRPAIFWYYKQVFASIGPVLWKQLVKWGVLAWIGEWIRRHI